MYILINSNVLANSTPFLKYKHLHNICNIFSNNFSNICKFSVCINNLYYFFFNLKSTDIKEFFFFAL